MTVMNNEDPADPSPHERSARTEDGLLKLAEVPIVNRGMGWQSNATATLREAAAQIAALKETLHNELDGNLRLRDLGGAKPDEPMTTFLERVFAERDALREVAVRMVDGIDHLSEIARLWEPDHSSGADRRGWLLAKDARDDAARLLGHNAELSRPGTGSA